MSRNLVSNLLQTKSIIQNPNVANTQHVHFLAFFIHIGINMYTQSILIGTKRHSLTKGDRELSADPMSMTSSPS